MKAKSKRYRQALERLYDLNHRIRSALEGLKSVADVSIIGY